MLNNKTFLMERSNILFKYSLCLLIALSAGFINVKAADRSTEIMQRCANKFTSAPAISINFTASQSAAHLKGSLVIKKKKFCLTTSEMSIWFDGIRQWTYFSSHNEVNITEPTGDELMESNPFEVITTFKTNFTCELISSDSLSDTVILTAKSDELSISSAIITINKSTGWPTALSITLSNGNSSSISIDKIFGDKSMPDSRFVFDKQNFPSAKIVDLR